MTATLNLTSAAPLTVVKSSSETATRAEGLSWVLASDLVKNLACGAAALAITAALSFAFVESSQTVPGSRTAAHSSTHAHFHLARLSIHRGHAWFGQTEPAVLVD
jgi:hypothetical protein